MDEDYEERPGWVRLPEDEGPPYPRGAARARASGVRRVTVTTGPGGVKVYHYRGDN